MNSDLHHQLDLLSERRLEDRLRKTTADPAPLAALSEALYGEAIPEGLPSTLGQLPVAAPVETPAPIATAAPVVATASGGQPLFTRVITPDGFDECLIHRMPETRDEWTVLLDEATWVGGSCQAVFWDAPKPLRGPLVARLKELMKRTQHQAITLKFGPILSMLTLGSSCVLHSTVLGGVALGAYVVTQGTQMWFSRRWKAFLGLTREVRYFKTLATEDDFPQDQLEAMEGFPDLARSAHGWLKRGWTRADSIELNFRLRILGEQAERNVTLQKLAAIAEPS